MSAEQDIKSSTVKLNDEQRRSTEGDSNQGRLPEGFIDGFVGTTFLNFKILRVIGRGAMGTVYQAEHLLLQILQVTDTQSMARKRRRNLMRI